MTVHVNVAIVVIYNGGDFPLKLITSECSFDNPEVLLDTLQDRGIPSGHFWLLTGAGSFIFITISIFSDPTFAPEAIISQTTKSHRAMIRSLVQGRVGSRIFCFLKVKSCFLLMSKLSTFQHNACTVCMTAYIPYNTYKYNTQVATIQFSNVLKIKDDDIVRIHSRKVLYICSEKGVNS